MQARARLRHGEGERIRESVDIGGPGSSGLFTSMIRRLNRPIEAARDNSRHRAPSSIRMLRHPPFGGLYRKKSERVSGTHRDGTHIRLLVLVACAAEVKTGFNFQVLVERIAESETGVGIGLVV